MRKRHLGTPEDRHHVRKLLKGADEGWRKERLIALKLGFSSENTLEDIAEVVCRDRATVQRWFRQFKQGGFNAVLKRNYTDQGRPSGCTEEIEAYLLNGLEATRWNTVHQAQEDLERHFDQSFKYQAVWRWLKKCAGVLRIPRPVHEKRDPVKAEAFKRNFFGKLMALPVTGKKPVKVWFADESRYGLLPNLRRVWTKKGLRPHKKWQSKYEFSYC